MKPSGKSVSLISLSTLERKFVGKKRNAKFKSVKKVEKDGNGIG